MTTQESITVDDFVEVEERASSLGLNTPSGLCFLPRNFAEAETANELLHDGNVTTLRVLFRQAGIEESRLEPDGIRIPSLEQKCAELVLPALFVAQLVYSSNPEAVSLALSVISNYVTEWFRASPGDSRVRFSVVLKDKRTGQTKRVRYSGDAEGIKAMAKLVDKLASGKDD